MTPIERLRKLEKEAAKGDFINLRAEEFNFNQRTALSANLLPKLLAVVEAARDWAIECREDIGHDKVNLTILVSALKALDEDANERA